MCERIERDSDGDGSSDRKERLDIGFDGNRDGMPDGQQNNVITRPDETVSISAEGIVDEFVRGIPAAVLEPGAQIFWDAFINTQIRLESAQGVRDALSQSNSSVTLTFFPAGEVEAVSFFNFGPTPDNPEPHWYEFLFDRTTGAEILEDRIIVHFVDGQRGEHDLTVNGEILVFGGPATPASVFYFPQVGSGVAGDIQFETAFSFDNTGGSAPILMEFFDPSNDPLELDLDVFGTSSAIQEVLFEGHSFSTQTSRVEGLQVGYARIVTSPGVGGTAIFSRSDIPAETILYEAGVPATGLLTDFTLVVDSMGNRDTGLALVYPTSVGASSSESAEEAAVTLRLYDSTFQLLAIRELTLGAGEHLAQFVRELFPTAADQAGEMLGSVTVESGQPLAAVTLRQNDDPERGFPSEVPTLTTFPVVADRADESSALLAETNSAFFFPQVGDGTVGNIRFQSSLVFVNTGEEAQLKIEFLDSAANPMTLSLQGLGTASMFELSLERGQVVSFQTPGTGALQVGYAQITASETVGGTVVFTRSEASQGTVLYEAGVPTVRPLTDFSVVVDSLQDKDTGLALVYPKADGTGPSQGPETTLTLRLYDQEFSLLDEVSLTLAEGQHLANFVRELFPDVAEQASEMEGTVTVHSDQPVAAVTLRQNDASERDFPQEVPTLTTFPVISGRAGLSP